MSQLLAGLSKLSSSRNNVLVHKSFRLFSTSPYLTLDSINGEDPPQGEGLSIGDVVLFDPAKEELVTVRNKTFPDEVCESTLIGASHGWAFFHDREHRHSVCVTDLFNPLTSGSNTKVIPLPPLTTRVFGHTHLPWNVAMSSSSPDVEEEEDCVVAIKFLGSQLSMCRPGRDLGWTHKQVPFTPSDNSNIMYSKRDQRFYLPAPGGNYLCSWDLNLEKDDPKFNELVFLNLPELPQSEWEELDFRHREDHWVESPSGQSFLVRWYERLGNQAPRFMVFREDQGTTKEGTKKMRYTEDIGDLCIFLSRSDPFCVVASSCPGLKPNSIYLMGRSFGAFDITTKTPHYFGLGPKKFPYHPFWLPPFPVM